MTLDEWLRAFEGKTGRKGEGGITELHFRTRVSMLTIRRARDGQLRNVEIAKKLSAGTGGKVSVESLLGLESERAPRVRKSA